MQWKNKVEKPEKRGGGGQVTGPVMANGNVHNIYALFPYKLLEQSQIAALPELCLLGKNTTFNNWSKWLWAKSH